MEQLGLGLDGNKKQSPYDPQDVADDATMQRLRALCSWAAESSPGGWQMRQAWRAESAWQSTEDAERASRETSKRMERRKSWATMTNEQRCVALSNAEPFVRYNFCLGRATRTVFSAHAPAVVILRDVEESAREIAAMCEAPAEVVIRYVVTGE